MRKGGNCVSKKWERKCLKLFFLSNMFTLKSGSFFSFAISKIWDFFKGGRRDSFIRDGTGD